MIKRVLIIFLMVFMILSTGRMAITSRSEVGAYQSGQKSTILETSLENPILVTRTAQQFTVGSILVQLELSVESESGSLPNGIIIKEQLPAESIMIHSYPQVNAYDNETGIIKWLLINDEIHSQTLNYEIQTDSSIDEIIFEGLYLYKLGRKRISRTIENL